MQFYVYVKRYFDCWVNLTRYTQLTRNKSRESELLNKKCKNFNTPVLRHSRLKKRATRREHEAC